MKNILLAVLLVLAVLPAVAGAATTTVTLTWDANTEPDLAGYKLYEAPASTGPWVLKQALGKVVTAAIPGVLDGGRCWAVTALDASGNESGRSNAVCLQLDTAPPAVPANLAATSLVRVP